ncbi:MAG TPA: tat pathway signal sequence [Streptosporangiaceae bacterium]|nr:tat pathway signal sequence [Streptosporangiaceae bacterium]
MAQHSGAVTAARTRRWAGGLLTLVVLAGTALTGCGLVGGQSTASSVGIQASRGPTPTSGVSPSPSPACPPAPAKFSCVMRARIAAVQQYLRRRPGVVGVVLRDRTTGALWQNPQARTPVYMASTSKLAMATTLLLENQSGAIHLSPADMATMHQMLHVSSDQDADALWFKFGAPFYTSMFPKIGLAHARYLAQAGVTGPYWGEMMCPATDLSRLITYVLTKLPPPLRAYFENTLRHVAADQHFGVWGAGPAEQPGNKDGWSLEKPGWIINTVGFAGPGARYTLAVMNSLNGHGGYHDGTDTVTQVAALLFRGHQVPAPRVSATP